MSKKNKMNQIIDGIYFEKLSSILTNIQQWQRNKNNTISDVYSQSIFNLFSKLQNNGKQLNFQMTEFLKILNMQYSFLCKLRKEDRNVQISPFYKEFKQFSDSFLIIKDSLLELNEYLGKFIGVTNYEFTELKRIYDEVEDLKYRYDAFINKLSHQFHQKKELIYSKKNVKKTFQLTKMIELMSDISKEKIYYNELSGKLYKVFERQIELKEKMYKDICDNIEFISKLYEKSLLRDILNKIKPYFRNRFQNYIKNEKQCLSRCKLDEKLPQSAFNQIQQKFYQYFDQFLSEITITRWSIIYQRKKIKEEDSQKQMPTNLILTFDNKLVFSPQDKKELLLQINLEDIKIYKANNEGKFQVKNRKTKEKFFIKFPKAQNEDEFFLHYQQLANNA